MVLNLNHKEKMQEDDIELKNCVHMIATRLIKCVPIVVTTHVVVVCLLSKLKSDKHIEVEVKMDELDLTVAESKVTYNQIKEYVLEKTGLKISNLYIAQVKQKCGIIERENYNKPKNEEVKPPICPLEKEKAIMAALKYFKMI